MTAKAKNLVIREVEESDIPAVVDLFRHNRYEEEKFLNAPFIRWQYLQGVCGRGILYGAFDGPKLAGIFNLALSWMSVRGQREMLAHTLGTLTDVDYRRVLFRDERGLDTLFTRLAKIAFEESERRGVAMTYGFPNAMSYPGFVQHLGFHDIGTMTFLVRPVRLRGLTGLKLKLPAPLLYLGDMLAESLACGLRWPMVDRGDLELRRMSEADPQLDDLARYATARYPLMQIRDRAYLQWRLFDHPVVRYEVTGAYRRGRLVGYLAWMISQRHDRDRGLTARMGHIVDYLCPPGLAAETDLDVLLQTALVRIRREGGMAALAVNTPVPEVLRAFRRCGFWAFAGSLMPRRFPYIMKLHCLRENVEAVKNWNNWYLTFLDNDVV